MPDRLPSLIVLVGFWVPPAVMGLVAARTLRKRSSATTLAVLAVVILGYAAAWYYFNLHRMPPYIPGATMDPRIATPEAARGLAMLTSVLILPGSALACALAFRWRARRISNTP